MKLTIEKTITKNYPSGAMLIVRTEEGRFTCNDESLFDAIRAAEGKTLDVEVNGTLIIGVSTPDADEVPFPNDDSASVDAEPEETSNTTNEETAPEVETVAEPPAKKAKAATTPTKRTRSKSDENPAAEKPAETQSPDDTASDDAEADTLAIAQQTEGLTDADTFEPNSLFPLLRAEEIEVRVNQITEDYVTLLLYKNARCDQDRLDAKYGPLGWQTSYKVLDGLLFCTVSVRNPDTGEWIEKTDVGTPSNTEAEKGRVSDAFKRACVCLGSGRELYSAPDMKIRANLTRITTNSKGKLVCYDKFAVKSIAYDSQRRISKLEIYGAYHRGIVFTFGK